MQMNLTLPFGQARRDFDPAGLVRQDKSIRMVIRRKGWLKDRLRYEAQDGWTALKESRSAPYAGAALAALFAVGLVPHAHHAKAASGITIALDAPSPYAAAQASTVVPTQTAGSGGYPPQMATAALPPAPLPATMQGGVATPPLVAAAQPAVQAVRSAAPSSTPSPFLPAPAVTTGTAPNPVVAAARVEVQHRMAPKVMRGVPYVPPRIAAPRMAAPVRGGVGPLSPGGGPNYPAFVPQQGQAMGDPQDQAPADLPVRSRGSAQLDLGRRDGGTENGFPTTGDSGFVSIHARRPAPDPSTSSNDPRLSTPTRVAALSAAQQASDSVKQGTSAAAPAAGPAAKKHHAKADVPAPTGMVEVKQKDDGY